MEHQAITARQFAEMLGVSESTVVRRAKSDGHVLGVPALRLGRVLRFSRVQVEAVLAGQKVAS